MLVCESQFDESKTLLLSNTGITISNDVGTYIIAKCQQNFDIQDLDEIVGIIWPLSCTKHFSAKYNKG